MKKENHSIELIDGYRDEKTGTIHKEVVFGKRLTVGDLILLDNDPQSQNPTQYKDLIQRRMMTRFGALKLPVALNVLLSLDTIDRDDLETAADKFLAETRGDRESNISKDFEVTLSNGFVIDGTEYPVIQFGNRITGKDRVDADAYGAGVANRAFLIGKQIAKISTEDGAASIDGKVSLDTFQSLDAESLNILWAGAELFRQSFRLQRKELPGERDGENGADSGDENRLDGK